MGGAEIGGILNDSAYTPEELEALKTVREQNPEKWGHVVLASEVPQPPVVWWQREECIDPVEDAPQGDLNA